MPNPSDTQTAMNANMAARQLIAARAVKMTQKIFSQTVNVANQNVLNITPRNVGLILGFFVEINATLADPATGTYALTNFGPANIVKQFQFYDLNNNIRIQTSGWHMHFVNSAKKRHPFCAVNTFNSYSINYGNIFGGNTASNQANNIIQAPSTYDTTHFAPGVQMLYWVPLAYSDYDLRGAVYANVVNSTMNLQVTLAQQSDAFVTSGSDPTLAIYQNTANSGGNWGTSTTVTVYQVYYDQLPVAGNGAPVLPIMDLSTIYELKNTALSGMTTGNDFPIPYSNFRDFLSTFAIYDNQNAGTVAVQGSDINYWALQSANFTNIFNVAPKYIGVWERGAIQADYPTEVYYFDTRDKPISTVQYGNMNLVLNPTGTVQTGAQVLVGYEDFALTNTLVGAASLSTAA